MLTPSGCTEITVKLILNCSVGSESLSSVIFILKQLPQSEALLLTVAETHTVLWSNWKSFPAYAKRVQQSFSGWLRQPPNVYSRVSRSRREEYGWSYSSNDDLSSLVVDAERRMAKFLAKTLIVCSGLVVLTRCILGQNGKWRKFAEQAAFHIVFNWLHA